MNEFTELNEADLDTVVGGTDADPSAWSPRFTNTVGTSPRYWIPAR